MKVSLLIPAGKGKIKILNFIDNEISENIKDKETTKALKKAKTAVLDNYPLYDRKGISIFSSDKSLIVEDYDANTFLYHCGKEYKGKSSRSI